jgi:N-acyl-D-aspartate/D-glutamate deacylase
MTTTARRPLNWNLLTVDSRTPEKTARQLEASARAADAGGRIVALTMPTLVPMNMSFRNHCALFLIPGWGDVMGLPVPERIEKLRDAAVRVRLDDLAHSESAGVFRRLSSWANYIIGDTFAPENDGLRWRDVGSIAAEQGKPPFDALLDLVIADELRTVLWPKASDGDDASWQARVGVWNDPGAMVGGSDAGAHLDRMCGSNYPTSFLGDCLRKRKLVPLERAIQMMTREPARLFGLHDRGLVEAGQRADLFVFDPDTIGSEPATLVNDLPGGSPRLVAEATGVVRVLVNGVETIVDGRPTGNLPGALLRSGRDTETVDPASTPA